ncbi:MULTISPECIES: hypothetical protein [Streptomyces]|uniref:Uncharacterized protein n=1 Tax=Streptomyces cremeus TaxID=66881 RepID=A0ABV5PND3_STRCM
MIANETASIAGELPLPGLGSALRLTTASTLHEVSAVSQEQTDEIRCQWVKI